MSKWKMRSLWLLMVTFCCILIPGSPSVAQEGGDKQIFSGICQNLTLEQIPVGDFKSDTVLPQTPYNINQWYNTPYEDGYWFDDVWIYGHDGIDSEGSSDTEGVNDVVSTQKGIVILSEKENLTAGWGESIIMATRPNKGSEEILTFHYHHLYNNGKSGTNYVTTRQFNACETVNRGALLGKEGSTGKSEGSHLHLTVRRWNSLQDLKNALQDKNRASLFGHGYTYNDDSKLQKHLDPHALLFKYFHDYQDPNQAYMWSLPYVKKMRKYGIEFGLFDGRYGAQQPATRGEVARWLKTALGIPSIKNVSATFKDVPADDPLFPYVEALTRFPASVANTHNAVINPVHSCTEDEGYSFCPDSPINRVGALKMIVVALYYAEFDSFQKEFYWTQTAADVLDKISLFLEIPKTQFFQDIDIHEWYAPYVYFGVWKGLVQIQTNFNPGQHVMREEMAKWIIKAYELNNSSYNSLCDNVACPIGQHCNPNNGSCNDNTECVPSETKGCEIGGGIDENSCNPGDCTPGETKQQSCGNGGTQTATCNGSCTWGAWGTCTGEGNCTSGQTASCGNCGTMTCGSNGQWGSCQNQGICQPGQQQNQTCNSVGTQTKTCSSSCNWGGWGQCTAECSPGQTQQQSCTVNGQSGTKERSCNSSGQWGSWSSCQSSCQDTYLASSSQSCYNNPQGSGNPTLCLNVQQNSGASWKYRVCKQGGAFSNSFSHQLRDDNHMVNYSTYNESTGVSCTNWKSFNLNQVTGYGAMNGAGLRAYIKSPTSCSQAACQYYTGSITIRKECL